jgi:hypothetical protein
MESSPRCPFDTARQFLYNVCIHADLLVIRFFLVIKQKILCSFEFCVGITCCGSNPCGTFRVSVDKVWSIINLYVHGSSLICLILDERQVSLTDDEDALWRISLTGGLLRNQNDCRPHLEIVEFE